MIEPQQALNLFEDEISEARALLSDLSHKYPHRTWKASDICPWPKGEANRPILAADTAVELGPPNLPSVFAVLLSGDHSGIQDETITLVGPDVGELAGKHAAMAKILFVAPSVITEENAYDLYLDASLSRLDISLKGYMIRASSQLQRERCRVSREALLSGISFAHIGAAEIHAVKRLPFMAAAEIAVVTASASDVAAFSPLAFRAERIASALCKLSQEIDHECETCDFTDLCSSLSGLKRLRTERQKGKRDQ